MAVVCATTPAHHVEAREPFREAGVLHPEFHGIACIEFGGVVQFSMALTGRVGSHPANAFEPRPLVIQHVLEMGWMGVNLLDGFSVSPVGRLPSVSTLNEMATGMWPCAVWDSA